MAEPNTNTVPTGEQAVSMASLAEASKLIATKAEVKQQIKEAVTGCAKIVFASTEDVLALFREDTETTPESGT